MADRFLVFVRTGEHAWSIVACVAHVGLAFTEAEAQAKRFTNITDRAAIMEVSGVDVVPMFTCHYLVRK